MEDFMSKSFKERVCKMFKTLKAFLCVSLFLFSSTGFTYDFYSEGNYSAEANFFDGVDLGNGSDGDKTYINHHLFLRPEVILFEGLSFHGGLDVLNGDGVSVPSSSRVGQLLGGALSSNSSGSSSLDVPAPFQQRQLQKSRALNISEAYLKYSHTNGELRIGRLPLEFGYGAFHNAGHDVFDHWYTNRDGVSYDFTFGSMRFNPMLHYLSDPLSSGSQTSEFGLKFGFSVEDTGLDLGFMVLQRHTPTVQNSLSPVPGGGFGNAKPITYSVFFNRKMKNLRYGFEALAQDGSAGVDSSGDEIALKGFGIAAEVSWNRGKWNLSSKLGYAGGDNAGDTSEISSVAMHRNYNLGLILFNHPLGAANYDPTGTNLRGRQGALGGAFDPSNTVDTDTISNARYIAPTVTFNMNRKWSLGTTYVMAWLEETNVLAGGGKVSDFLGSEFDFTLDYKPTEKIILSTSLGYFLPGSAFKGSGSLETDNVFGATTRLGISF